MRATDIADVPQLCALLNEIIEIGGTTAHQKTFSHKTFAEKFLLQETKISSLVACNEAGERLGFQTVDSWADLPDDWGDISTFARVSDKVKGVGTALFEATCKIVRENGFVAINAAIRADNVSGLAYYEKMGFETYEILKDRTLADGTIVDRVLKRYFLS